MAEENEPSRSTSTRALYRMREIRCAVCHVATDVETRAVAHLANGMITAMIAGDGIQDHRAEGKCPADDGWETGEWGPEFEQ